MAILGASGILELSRDWPAPMMLRPEALNLTTGSLAIGNRGYWTGDHVLLVASSGVPIDTNGDGYADNPEGHGFYFGGTYDLGPARAHASSSFYQSDDTASFYNTSSTTGLTKSKDAYININAAGRALLYNKRTSAYNANSADLVVIENVKVSNLIVLPYNSDADYINAAVLAAGQIRNTELAATNQELDPTPDGITSIANDPDRRGWLIQSDLTSWALNIDASTLDMTAIGEAFGENTKSLVRGSGTLEFFVDNRNLNIEQASLVPLQLVLLVERGSKANARFYLYKDRDPALPKVNDSVYYECDILLSRTQIDVKADTVVTGSADFVATSEIALRFEP